MKRRPSGKRQRPRPKPRLPLKVIMHFGSQAMPSRCRLTIQDSWNQFGRQFGRERLAIERFRDLTRLDTLMEYMTEELHHDITNAWSYKSLRPGSPRRGSR